MLEKLFDSNDIGVIIVVKRYRGGISGYIKKPRFHLCIQMMMIRRRSGIGGGGGSGKRTVVMSRRSKK